MKNRGESNYLTDMSSKEKRGEKKCSRKTKKIVDKSLILENKNTFSRLWLRTEHYHSKNIIGKRKDLEINKLLSGEFFASPIFFWTENIVLVCFLHIGQTWYVSLPW